MGETLTLEMSFSDAPAGATTAQAEFDGEQVTVGVLKVQ